LHISGKKGILISDKKRNMLAAANKKKTEKKHNVINFSKEQKS